VELTVGDVVDEYRLDRVIHRGRSTLVCAATDLALGRRVAFKALVGPLAADADTRERFAREARIAAALGDHPNVVTVHRWGQVRHGVYYVAELIAGISLAELIRRQPGALGLPVHDALPLLGEVADAVDFAHRRGLIHRDVKPANVVVRMAELPMRASIVDFGIARELGAGATDSGATVGTPDYVAPEQLAGGALDGRADVYSLGCTAYETLCGRPPFADAPDDAARLAAHLRRPVPPITGVRSGLPAGFDPVLRRALAKDPAERFGTCAEFVAALRHASPAPRRP
jgi:serine/threonine-protein kinase